MKVKANGIMMHYETEGSGDNLVLFHALGQNLNMWYHQVPVFSKTYRVIAYDIRGAGETEDHHTEYSVSLLIEDAYEFLKVLGIREGFLVGCAAGGAIAMGLTLNYPDMVKGVVLAGSGGGFPTQSSEPAERRKALSDLLAQRDIKRIAEFITTGSFSVDFKSKKPNEFDKVTRIICQNKPEGIARLIRAFHVWEGHPDFSEVKCPVLLIVGEEDTFVGVQQARRVERAIPNSELIILPGGRIVPIETPGGFNQAVLRFLSEIRAK